MPTFSNNACHPCTGVMPNAYSSSQKKQYVRDILAQRAMQKAHYPQYSAVGFSVIFALLGEQWRVPAFHPSQTLRAASQAVDEGATHQESVSLLHSSSLGFVLRGCSVLGVGARGFHPAHSILAPARFLGRRPGFPSSSPQTRPADQQHIHPLAVVTSAVARFGMGAVSVERHARDGRDHLAQASETIREQRI